MTSTHELDEMLICPVCRDGASLQRSEGTLLCASCGHRFGSFAGLDVLMTDESTALFGLGLESGRSGVASADERVLSRPGTRARMLRRMKSMVVPENETAARAAAAIGRLADDLDRPVSLLVVGGGTTRSQLSEVLDQSRVKGITFDVYPSAKVDFLADAHSIPFDDATFDAVWIQAVLEHVAAPWVVADEIQRVTRVGGLIYAETPFMQSVHEGAYDFFRFNLAGARLLFRKCEVADRGVVAGSGVSLQWAIRDVAVSIGGDGSLVRRLAYLPGIVFNRIGRSPKQRNFDRASAIGVLFRRTVDEVRVADVVADYGT